MPSALAFVFIEDTTLNTSRLLGFQLVCEHTIINFVCNHKMLTVMHPYVGKSPMQKRLMNNL